MKTIYESVLDISAEKVQADLDKHLQDVEDAISYIAWIDCLEGLCEHMMFFNGSELLKDKSQIKAFYNLCHKFAEQEGVVNIINVNGENWAIERDDYKKYRKKLLDSIKKHENTIYKLLPDYRWGSIEYTKIFNLDYPSSCWRVKGYLQIWLKHHKVKDYGDRVTKKCKQLINENSLQSYFKYIG